MIMLNKARGDVEFIAGNTRHAMRLTLGALAEIEDALGADSLADLAERLKRLGTGDIAAVASALMRGAGAEISAAEVLKLDTDLGHLIAAIGQAFDAAGLSGTGEGGARNASPLAGTSSSPQGSA
jgi:tail tube GTA-gp10-like protein